MLRYPEPYYLIMLYDLIQGGYFVPITKARVRKFHLLPLSSAESSNLGLFRNTAFTIQAGSLFPASLFNSSVTPKSHKGNTVSSWRPGSFQ